MHPTKTPRCFMAKIRRTDGMELEIVNAIIAAFGGEKVYNQDLQDWLCSQFPDTFPTGRADGFIEYVGAINFASTQGEQPKDVRGYAALAGFTAPRPTSSGKPSRTVGRWWKIPSRPYNRLPTKAEVFGRAGVAVARPMATNERQVGFYTDKA